MFKVPDWEDVPKNCVKSRKKGNNKKQTKKANPPKADRGKKIQKPVNEDSKLNNRKEKKEKLNGLHKNDKKKTNNSAIDITKVDTENADEAILNAKKKKFYEPIERDDVEDLLFREVTEPPPTTVIVTKNEPKNVSQVTNSPVMTQQQETITVNKHSKKEKIRALLEVRSTRNSIPVRGNKLRERMLNRLKAAQFRYLNEKLYTSSGSEAKQLFQSDPTAFRTYHQGYQQQLKKWPVNPLDLIVKRILRMPKSYTIADMGCGEAALAARVPHAVRSFDLVPAAPGVETCDMARTPLLAATTDVAVYCLALMGTDLTQYLVEANRVLKMGGHLLIAEVESRFDNVDAFTKDVMKLGFKLKNLDKSHTVFFFMEFVKIRDPSVKKSKLPTLTLKPCLYKKR